MKPPKGYKVKWSTTPTTFDQKECDGLYIQEITVKWWILLRILWKFLKNYDLQLIIGKRFKFKMPHFISFVYFIIKGRKSKVIRDFIVGG